MDWSTTILTSGVIAALITGIFSFVSAIMKSNKEARLSRITDERKVWRDKIRQVAEEFSTINFDHFDNDKDELKLILLLTKLKTRINSSGFCDDEDFLKDSHIWSSIRKLEEKETRSNTEIKKLINYLSALLKHDWERSKLEVRINTSQIVGYGVYAISNGLLVYCAYDNFTGTEIKDVVLLVAIFLVMFFSPDLLLFVYRMMNLKRDWANIIIPYVVAFILYGGLIFISTTIVNDGTEALVVPMILQLIAIIFIVISQYKNHKNDSDYIKEIKKINEEYDKNIKKAN